MSRDAAAVAKRATRALDRFFHVESASGPNKYHVHSGSGNTYTVALPKGTCTCPDGQRGPWCKHALRTLFVTGHTPDIDGVHSESQRQETNNATGTPDSDGDTDDTDDGETLTERVERFEANNPGASAIEAISQLGINPDQKEQVEEVLS